MCRVGELLGVIEQVTDWEYSRSDGISLEELQLAARNHGMPLEALRHEITPVGLHYLLIHYDIPVVDAGAWRLAVGGLVERPLELTLDDLRAPRAGDGAGDDGVRRQRPRATSSRAPVSQPWLAEAVGTAEWTGVPLAPLLAEAGLARRASRSCSPGSTAASRAASSRTTSAACRSPTRDATTSARLRLQRRAAAAAARLPAAAASCPAGTG